jgi:hypothetical protein
MNQSARRYQVLLETLDAWTAAAHQRHPNVIPCRQGCTACCLGPFDISVADVLLLQQTVTDLPPDHRARLLNRADAAAARQRERAPDWEAPFDVRDLGEDRFDGLCDALEAEPCPCLEDGVCVVYAGRPAVCRMMGLGLASPDDRRVANGCPIQSEFPAYQALRAQPFDLPAFETTEEACLVEAGLTLFDAVDAAGYETTIALALSGQIPRS